MKKLFSLLAVAAMAFTACQNDEGVKNPTLADEGIVNLSVGVPELATRTTDQDGQSGFDSAYGAIDYGYYGDFLGEYDVRFQLAVYEANAAEDAEPVYTATNYVDLASTTSFNDLRFVPGREYQFVVFADFVKQGTQEDFRYNTADLRNITAFEPLNAMDETYDAYFFNQTIKVEAGKINQLEATLKRPFAKVRVLTTDLAWVEDYAVPAEGVVTFYNHPIYKSFNAVTGEVATEATNEEETLPYAIDGNYYRDTKYNNASAFTLFATYVLATDAQETLNFRLDTKEADGTPIKSLDFNTEIPYQRNHLTTLVGNLLTSEADVEVRIDDNFDAEEFQTGDWDNLEEGLGYIREGVLVGGDVYRYETNLFNFRLYSETDGTELREGTYEYGELIQIQNARAFDIEGIDVEKGTLTIAKDGENYDVVFDIYATINGKTENYILTWNGSLKGAREALATPVVTWEVDEVDNLYITFSWEAVEGAKNYTVEWNGEKQTVEGTSATFDFSGEDTYATAYVTANPELTWSYEAATGSVTVDWKKPIVYTEVEVFLQYVKGVEVAFYNDNYTVYFENYPSLEGAWYQVAGQIPTSFSKEAEVVETTGSAAQVAIYEPTTATCFLYKGAMNPYILTEAEVNWLAGYKTVKVKFSNEAGDAIEFQTSAPMEAGHATIEPSYVAIGGDQAGDIKDAEMNVLLKNGEYTIFFTIHSATNDVLMQYVGAIDFEEPYAPEYELTSYEARENTIYFKGEGVEYEIEATSLESGDVVVKYIAIQDSQMEITAATAVVTEKDGVYDARYTLPLGYTNPFTGKDTFDLQYVGPFKAYEAPAEPEKPIEFEATYENVEGLAVFTGVDRDFKVFVNKLETIEYDGSQADGWGTKDLKFPAGEGFNRFNHGDVLTVNGDEVVLEFTATIAGDTNRFRMTASTAPAVAEPETVTVKLEKDGDTYVSGNYKIFFEDGAYVVLVTNQKLDGGLPYMINLTDENVFDSADELAFEFFDKMNNVNVEAFYTKNAVEPIELLRIGLGLDEATGYLVAQYEDTTYTIAPNEGNVGIVKKGTETRPVSPEIKEVEGGILYTFFDELNNWNVEAFYQTSFGPEVTEPTYVEFTKMSEGTAVATGTAVFNLSNETGNNKVSVHVDSRSVAAGKIAAGEYTFVKDGPTRINDKTLFAFTNKSLVVNGAAFANADIAGTMTVDANGKITFNLDIFEAEYVLVYTPSNTPAETPYETLTLIATYETLVGSVKAYHAEPYWINDNTWMEGNPLTGIKQEGKLDSTEKNGNVTTFKFTDDVNHKNVVVTYTEKTAEPEQTVVENIKATYKNGSFGKISVNFADANNAANNFDCTFTYSGYTANGTYTIGENATVENGTGTIVVTVNDPNYSFNIDATVNGVVYKGTVTIAL